jgi:hypothetical protein
MKRTTNVDNAKKSLSLEELVDQLIANGMKALESGKMKVTVADLVRLRERQLALAPTPPLTDVTWIDG